MYSDVEDTLSWPVVVALHWKSCGVKRGQCWNMDWMDIYIILTGEFLHFCLFNLYVSYLCQVKVQTWVDGVEDVEFVGVGARFGPTIVSKEKNANQTHVALSDPRDCCSPPKKKVIPLEFLVWTTLLFLYANFFLFRMVSVSWRCFGGGPWQLQIHSQGKFCWSCWCFGSPHYKQPERLWLLLFVDTLGQHYILFCNICITKCAGWFTNIQYHVLMNCLIGSCLMRKAFYPFIYPVEDILTWLYI